MQRCAVLLSETLFPTVYGLVGLVVKEFTPKMEGSEFESRLRQDFSGSSHTSDIKIGTPVVTLPGAWRYRVSAGTVSVYCDWGR